MKLHAGRLALSRDDGRRGGGGKASRQERRRRVLAQRETEGVGPKGCTGGWVLDGHGQPRRSDPDPMLIMSAVWTSGRELGDVYLMAEALCSASILTVASPISPPRR